jgi:quinolinate synthase
MTATAPVLTAAAIDPSLDLFAAIEQLKQERKAIVLAHYYQEPDIQDVADHLGDSLELARRARDARDAEVICFCGVHFMAETAKILAPSKTVVLPDLDAGCSLAEACPAPALAAWRKLHPAHTVVTYINCSAATKAESDIICTSSNAEAVIRSIPAGTPILFAPDKNLGAWLIEKTGRQMDLWPGTCIVHMAFSERQLLRQMAAHPDAVFIAHPECEEMVLRHAHFVGSTSKLLSFVVATPAREIIVATEKGILHEMRKRAPDKVLLEAAFAEGGCGCNECPHMKKNTLEKVYLALRDLRPRIELDESLRLAALTPLNRMFEVSPPAT